MVRLKVKDKIDNAIKWIDGLSKTRFRQGKEQLGNSKEGYCCLGYGCMKLGLDYNFEGGTSRSFQESVGLLDEQGLLADGKTFEGFNAQALTSLNDCCDQSFNEISKHIKNNLGSLFTRNVAKGLKNHYKNRHEVNR